MIKDKLKEIREDSEMNKKEFAEYIGVKYTTYNGYETGAREPDSDFLKMIAKRFDISTDYILGLQTEKEIKHAYELSKAEYTRIEKYRSLDDDGKKHIDYELNREFARVEEARAQKERIKTLETEFSSELIPARIITYCQRLASAGSGEYLFDDVPTDVIKVEDTPESRKADFVIGVNGSSMEPDYYDGEKVFVKKTPDIGIGDVGVFVRGNECFIKECGKNGLISRNKSYPGVEPFSDGIKVVGRVIGKATEID